MDVWDWFALVFVGLVLSGVAAIYWPLSLILGGLLGLAFYFVRERTLVPQPPVQPKPEE